MLALWSRFLGGGAWEPPRSTPPWGDRPSIYEHIVAHIEPGLAGLTEGGETLPDEGEVFQEGGLRWVAGGLDGAFGHAGGGSEKDAASEIATAIRKSLRRPTARNITQLYAGLKAQSTLDYIDLVIEELSNGTAVDPDRLHGLALWLATSAADREPVKVALALLGILQGTDDGAVILTLGRHEEFTLYSAVAITNIMREPERTLWDLGKHVDGWGRIQVVERLAETKDPQIKSWLLREGYRNSVMYEYLAYTCAVAGELDVALQADTIDRELLVSVGEIIQALIAGGPAEGIDDYQHAAGVIARYLVQVRGSAETLEEFLVLKNIERFLGEEADWDGRAGGWTDTERRRLLAQVEAMVGDPKWRDLARQGLASIDDARFSTAAQAARALDIDPWEHHFARTEQGKSDWYYVMQTDDVARVRQVIDLAERSLPLDAIASGPSDALGLGPEFRAHSALEFVLQDLRRFPGEGWTLIRTGMQSPVVRGRHMAIRALQEWVPDAWPPGSRAQIEAFRTAEPDDEVRVAFDALLSGERGEVQ